MDSGGTEHTSSGVGTIQIGGYTIPCFWAPTLRVSVVSTQDLTDLDASIIIHTDGHVYAAGADNRTLTWLGKAASNIETVPSIRFVGIQNKQDNYDAFWIHKQYAHANERITRQICAQENIPFSASDGVAIRNCPTCFETKSKAASHNKHSHYPSPHRLHRIHLDTAEYSKQRWVTYITDEYSSYVWAVFATAKGALIERTKAVLHRINLEYHPNKIVYITKDGGTELPSTEYLNTNLNALCEDIPPYTPVLNGRAERTNGIITNKAMSLVSEATSNDVLRELLEVYAIDTAVLMYNATPTAKGHIPRDKLRNSSGHSFRNNPYFGIDVMVIPPNDKLRKERKMQNTHVLGIYLGTNTDNGNVHSVWTNFTEPGSKMKIIKATNVNCTGLTINMRKAEARMAEIQTQVALQAPLDAPLPAEYDNLTLGTAKKTSSAERKHTRIIRPMPHDESHLSTSYATDDAPPPTHALDTTPQECDIPPLSGRPKSGLAVATAFPITPFSRPDNITGDHDVVAASTDTSGTHTAMPTERTSKKPTTTTSPPHRSDSSTTTEDIKANTTDDIKANITEDIKAQLKSLETRLDDLQPTHLTTTINNQIITADTPSVSATQTSPQPDPHVGTIAALQGQILSLQHIIGIQTDDHARIQHLLTHYDASPTKFLEQLTSLELALRSQEHKLASLEHQDDRYTQALAKLATQQREYAAAHEARTTALLLQQQYLTEVNMRDMQQQLEAHTSELLEHTARASGQLIHDVQHHVAQTATAAIANTDALRSDVQREFMQNNAEIRRHTDQVRQDINQDIVTNLTSLPPAHTASSDGPQETVQAHERTLKRLRDDICESLHAIGHHKRQRITAAQLEHDHLTHLQDQHADDLQPTVEEPTLPERPASTHAQPLLTDYPHVDRTHDEGTSLEVSTPAVTQLVNRNDQGLDGPILDADAPEGYTDNDDAQDVFVDASDTPSPPISPHIPDDVAPDPPSNIQRVPTDRSLGVLPPGSIEFVDVDRPRVTRSKNPARINRLMHLLDRHTSLLTYVNRITRLATAFAAPLTSSEGALLPRKFRRSQRKTSHSLKVSVHRLHAAIADNRRRLLAHPVYGKLVVTAELDEIAKLRAMKVYVEMHISEIPKGTVIIGSRFVHTIDELDKKSNGKVKARCVAQGFKQPIGPEDTYSPVILPESLRAFVMSAVTADLTVKQMDVSSAYLHAELDEPVYIRPPKGLAGTDENTIWKCTKALYGLKNAGRAWYQTFKEKLEGFGLTRTMSDHGLFTKTTERGTMQVALYVDDLLVSFHDKQDYEEFKTYMSDVAEIKIKDLGDMSDFCGMEFTKSKGGYHLHQSKYINDLLVRFQGFLTEKKQKVPINPYIRSEDLELLDEKGIKLYQELLGCFNWLAGNSRPDLGYAVSKFASFTKDATHVDLSELKKVLMYLRDTRDFTIDILKAHYPDGKVKLYAFSDASFANEEGRRSRTGYIIYVNGTPLAWKTKKQTLVTTSTFAAEYVALSHTTTDLLWMKSLFEELGMEMVEVPKILEDNNGVVLSVNGTGSSPSNAKSVDIKEKHIQDRVQSGEVKVEHVGSQSNISDTFTKSLMYVAFGKHYPFLSFDSRFAIRLIAIRRT